MKVEVYGHDIELTDPKGEIVTDVMILARSVSHNDDGSMDDRILTSTTATTTGMIQRGMLAFAQDSFVGRNDDE